jgi:hypothetical protein
MNDYTHPKDEELFAAIGRLSMSWAHVEFGLEVLVHLIFYRLGNPLGEAEPPIALKRKVRFIRHSTKLLISDVQVIEGWNKVFDAILQQAQTRHDIIHGAVIAHESGEGEAAFYRVLKRSDPVEATTKTYSSADILKAAISANKLAAPLMAVIGHITKLDDAQPE